MKAISKSVVKTGAVALALSLSVVGLAACSGSHQVIDSGEACVKCHSDEKATYEVANPKGAVSSDGELTVKSSASQIAICKVTFISEDGSRFVPMQYSAKQVSDGQASISLEEGTWALCVIDGSDVKKSQIVVVSDSGAASAVVEL